MSLIDDIRRDREAGTPGPYFLEEGSYGLAIIAPDGDAEPWSVAIAIGDCGPGDATPANARRIARVPQLEEIALAAEALAEALRDRCLLTGATPETRAALAAYRKATEGGE